MNNKPDDFNWVSEVGRCSPARMFEKLKEQVRKDLEQREQLRPKETQYAFDMTDEGDTFTVMLIGHSVHQTVSFRLTDRGISISGASGQWEATPTVNDEGDCVLAVAGQERSLWQVRKKALEQLFFGTFRHMRQ